MSEILPLTEKTNLPLAESGTGFNLKLTQGGAVLLAKALAGQQLEFKYVTLGSGVGSGNPEEATSLVNKVADLFIVNYKRLDTSVIVEAVLEYNSVPQGFTWTELGVIAIDPDTQEKVLYMYDYVQIGEVIPPAGAATQIEKQIRISTYVSNAANVTAEINESLINIPKSDIGQPNGVAPLNEDSVLEIKYGGTFAKDSPNALYNLGCGVRKNYFDNPDFKINQEKAEYNIPISMGKIVDRWYSEGIGNCEYTENGIITNNQYARQMWSSSTITAGKWTVSALCTGDIAVVFGKYGYADIKVAVSSTNYDNGLASVTFDIPQSLLDQISYNDYIYIICKSGLGTNKGLLKYVKFEKGETQTLARKLEDGSWKLLETPDYATELAKCQRYLRVGQQEHYYAGAMYAPKEGIFTIPPIFGEMRIKRPTINAEGENIRILGYDGTSIALTHDELSVFGSDCFGIKVKVTLSGDKVLPIGTAVIADALFTFDAEL